MTPEELDVAAAFREWASTHSRLYGRPINLDLLFDAYLAGARMAREQAKPLAQYLQDRADRDDAEADRILAKYQGEA